MNGTLLETVEEAARQLAISRTRTYELIGSGELESVKIGRSRRVPRKAIEAFVSRLVEQPNAMVAGEAD